MLLSCVALAFPLAMSAGCSNGDSPQRFQISGTVTFDGKPVPFGSIVFEPDVAAGNAGPQGAALIIDGKYSTRPEQGLVGGPHLVRIDGNESLPSQEKASLRPLFRTYEVRETFAKENTTWDVVVPGEAGKRAKSGGVEPPARRLRPEQEP